MYICIQLNRQQMKKTIIITPYTGSINSDKEYAQECFKDSIKRGEAAISSFILYSEYDEIGLDSIMEWTKVCDQIIFYTDNGMTVSMRFIEKWASINNDNIKYRNLR